jgi:hypothetical protein
MQKKCHSVHECNIIAFLFLLEARAAAQLVEALHYKPEGSGFDSRECHWNF